MISIVEYKKKGNTFYMKNVYDHKGELISTEKIKYKTSVEEINNRLYYILYDTNMEVIRDVFKLLNVDLWKQSPNSKDKNLHGLKLLFTFSHIINVDIPEFSSSDINNFISFLQGKSVKGGHFNMQLSTERNAETVSSYLSSCRVFTKEYYNDKEASKFLELDGYKTYKVTLSDEYTHKATPYKNRVKLQKGMLDEVPAYISEVEFGKIISIIREEYTVLEECIIRLMYETGLRIGEVLGLTSDDLITEEKNSDSGRTYISYAELRNRVSDKTYQHAKTCMNVQDVSDYQLTSYQEGYQTVIVPQELFEIINFYIETYHMKYRKTKKENYYLHAKADRVREASKYEDINYYIFLNSQGRTLSQRMWSRSLRKIFLKADIEIDNEKRKKNLSHRFRHGFAVFCVKKDIKIMRLKELMRVRSTNVLEKYYQLTLSDKAIIKEAFTDDLYDCIPELRTYNYDTKEGDQ